MPDNTPTIADKFAGLPMGLLICSPIIEVAKGQAELCNVYLRYLFSLAYKDGDVAKGEANIISFKLTRPVTDGQGNITTQDIVVNAPLVSLVPVPAFTMAEATVSFTMEVKEQSIDTSKSAAEVDVTASYSFWGFSASVTGKVSTESSHTRESDQSAKYEVTARAVQQPPAEGMAKLTQLFASVIEPIPVGGSK